MGEVKLDTEVRENIVSILLMMIIEHHKHFPDTYITSIIRATALVNAEFLNL